MVRGGYISPIRCCPEISETNPAAPLWMSLERSGKLTTLSSHAILLAEDGDDGLMKTIELSTVMNFLGKVLCKFGFRTLCRWVGLSFKIYAGDFKDISGGTIGVAHKENK